VLLSQGAPMLPRGDEFGPHPGRQQQRVVADKEISWFDCGGLDWERPDRDLIEFVKRLIRCCQDSSAVSAEKRFLTGREVPRIRMPDGVVLRSRRPKMTQKDWPARGGNNSASSS